MRRAFIDNSALFLGVALLMAANGLLVTLLTIRGSEIGFSETTIGLIQACYPVGALLGASITPKLVERVGHVRAFGALASLCSIAAVVHLMTDDAVVWSAMRGLAGFCFPGLYVVSESWLNARAESRHRARLLSVYFVIQLGGAAAGQTMAGLEVDAIDLFGIASILISLSLAPLLLSRQEAPSFAAPERLSLRALAKASPMAVTNTGLNGATQAAFYVGTPLYGLSLGYDAAAAAGLLVLGTLASGLAQFPIGWISDRVDRRVVVAGLGGVGAAAALFLASGPGPGWVELGVAVFAMASLPIYSICVAHANDHLRPSQIAPASGALVLCLNIGVLFGAYGGPAAIGSVGGAGFMTALAALNGVVALVALVHRARRASPEGTGEAYPIAVAGVQATGALHPDAEAGPSDQPADKSETVLGSGAPS